MSLSVENSYPFLFRLLKKKEKRMSLSVENSYPCMFGLSKKKEKRTSSRHSLLVTSLNCQYEQLIRRGLSLFLLHIYLIDLYICVKKQLSFPLK